MSLSVSLGGAHRRETEARGQGGFRAERLWLIPDQPRLCTVPPQAQEEKRGHAQCRVRVASAGDGFAFKHPQSPAKCALS